MRSHCGCSPVKGARCHSKGGRTIQMRHFDPLHRVGAAGARAVTRRRGVRGTPARDKDVGGTETYLGYADVCEVDGSHTLAYVRCRDAHTQEETAEIPC